MIEQHTKAEYEALYRDLLTRDDVHLFTQGGCAIFAITLHETFGFPIRWIPGHDGVSASHVYCRIYLDNGYAVDVTGTKDEAVRVLDDFGGLGANDIDLVGLRQMFRPVGERGFVIEPWFVEPATARAHARIQRYRPYYDGSIKAPIIEAPADAV